MNMVDGDGFIDVSEVLKGTEIYHLDEGTIVLDAVIAMKCLGPDGEVVYNYRSSKGLGYMEKIGMCHMMTILYEDLGRDDSYIPQDEEEDEN